MHTKFLSKHLKGRDHLEDNIKIDLMEGNRLGRFGLDASEPLGSMQGG